MRLALFIPLQPLTRWNVVCMQHKKDLKRSLLALGMVALLAMTTAPTASASGESALEPAETGLDGPVLRGGAVFFGVEESEMPLETRPAGEFVFIDVIQANGTWRVLVSNTAPGGLPFMVHVDGIPEEWWGSTVTLAADELVFSVVAEGPLATFAEVSWFPGSYVLTITDLNGESLLQRTGMDLTSKRLLPDVEVPEPEDLLRPRRASHDDPCYGNSRTSYPNNYCNQSSNYQPKNCRYYSTEKQWVDAGVSYFERQGTSTAAWELTHGNHDEDWAYWQSGSSSAKYAGDAYSFGHGFYGANRYVYGHDYDIAFGVSIEGSNNMSAQYNYDCEKNIVVGDRFVVTNAQVFYRDVSAVVATHETAWETGYPASSCSTGYNTYKPIVDAALGLTKYGSFISAAIPDKWCTKNWVVIKSDAFGASGLGVQTDRATYGSYEGGEGFIRTHYSSTGRFDMDLDGAARVNAWFNACNACYATTTSFWRGWALTAEGLSTTS